MFDFGANAFLIQPWGYMIFLYLWKNAPLSMTYSCGLQEEATALGVPA